MASRAQNKSVSSLGAKAACSAQASASEANHALKLSIDLLSIKDLKISANLVCDYQLKLSSGLHSFRSEKPTPVS